MPAIMLPLISHITTQYPADEQLEGIPTTISIKIPEEFTKFLTGLAKTFDIETFELFEIYFQSLILNGLMLDKLAMDNFFETYAEVMHVSANSIVDVEKNKFKTVCKKFIKEQAMKSDKTFNNPFG